jgi:hypothetical protein
MEKIRGKKISRKCAFKKQRIPTDLAYPSQKKEYLGREGKYVVFIAGHHKTGSVESLTKD